MSEDKKPDLQRAKTYTEQEHKDLLVREINDLKARNFQYSIDHGQTPSPTGLWPTYTIHVQGGFDLELEAVVLKIEAMLLDYATKKNMFPDGVNKP